LLTLAYLLSAGCGSAYVAVTTSALGRAVGLSQQAASAHLAELERDGMIRRTAGGRGRRIRVTDRGYAEMTRVSSLLRAAVDGKPRRILRGTVVSGVGEGAYYMSLPGYVEQFRSMLEMVPYPGTLNVRLDSDSTGAVLALGASEGTLVRGFDDGQRTYGWVRCYGALLQAAHGGTPPAGCPPVRCHLIRLERTHHDTSIAELISPRNLRESASVGDGSKVTITLE
jgi:riboflavin kinase